MLSEEEKKAIEYLEKNFVNNDIIFRQWFEDMEYYEEEKIRKSIETILNLIEKQQAEIKERDKIIEKIENLCIEKGDDENENYGGIVIWKFAVQIIDIIRERNKVEEDK